VEKNSDLYIMRDVRKTAINFVVLLAIITNLLPVLGKIEEGIYN
jgi:hypothetical protein